MENSIIIRLNQKFIRIAIWLLNLLVNLFRFWKITIAITGVLQLSGDWKNLRRAFKKLDPNNEGYLSLKEFRSVLELANVLLDEEEVFHVMSQFDEDMTGRIPYNKFLSEAFNAPSTKQSIIH